MKYHLYYNNYYITCRLILILVLMSLFCIGELSAQPELKLLIEPYSGITWTKTERYSSNYHEPVDYITYFYPGKYTGIGAGVERKRWSIGMDIRVQKIAWRDKEMLSWDTFNLYYTTYIYIKRLKCDYMYFSRKNMFAKIQMSYALPSKSGFYIRRIKRIDNAGNVETLGEYWYQRTGAFYGGLNFTVRSSDDRYRAGINLGAERLRHKGKSFGEWYNHHDRDRWYYMAGLSFTYTVGLKNKQGK